MIKLKNLFVCVFLLTASTKDIAIGGTLFGATGLDPSFCDKKAFRNTVIYIDDTMMRDGQTSWATIIVDKLRATLVPNERVSLVQISPFKGASHQIWTGCWPEYSAEERNEISRSTYLLTENPLAVIKKQQSFFLSELGVGLTQIYTENKSSKPPQQEGENQPRKSIVEALASDGARFSQSLITTRAIVYSDLAENSELGSIFSKSPPPDGIGKKLGASFRRSIFYLFGVGTNKKSGV